MSKLSELMKKDWEVVEIFDEIDIPYSHKESGLFSAIIREPSIVEKFTDRGVLKIFFEPITKSVEDVNWGRPFLVKGESTSRYEYGNVIEGLKVQNILSLHDFSPKVYDVKILRYRGKDFIVAIVEDIKGDFANSIKDMAVRINRMKGKAREIGIKASYIDFASNSNLKGNKWLDFQGWGFTDNYEDLLIERYKDRVTWSGNVYQQLGDVNGYRSRDRDVFLIEVNNTVSFKGKTVLDVGCSGGAFTRFALNRYAKKVTAIDLPSVIEATREVNNYLGYFNVDYIAKDITADEIPNAEVIFYMSVYRYFGYAKALKNAKIVIYEHNGDEEYQSVVNRFEKDGFRKEYELVTGADGRRSAIFRKIN